jgi:hypothetical protein
MAADITPVPDLSPTERAIATMRARRAAAVCPPVGDEWLLLAEVERLRRENTRQDRDMDQLIGERDAMYDIADKLAYAVAPEEVIGEHSSDNCPWDNALDLITPMAEVDRLRKDVADYEQALAIPGEDAA